MLFLHKVSAAWRKVKTIEIKELRLDWDNTWFTTQWFLIQFYWCFRKNRPIIKESKRFGQDPELSFKLNNVMIIMIF